MPLRSSSTPVLGSLLSSITDGPNNNHHEISTPFRHYPYNRFSFIHPSSGSLHFSAIVSCGSSPVSPSVTDQLSGFDLRGFRRTHSEGNLEALAYAACGINNEEFDNQNQPNKHSARHKCLQTIPSFSFYNSKARCEEEEDENDLEEEEDELKGNEEELLACGKERVMAVNGSSTHEFNAVSVDNMLLNEEGKVMDKIWNVGFGEGRALVGQEMFLARRVGVDGGTSRGGGGGESNSAGSSGDGGDHHEVEEYYERMAEENPRNPLYLGNYAQFLYQSKRDLQGAEEYYCRAILADPKDGETLSQYAKLVWELHDDEERASTYFERAVQSSPQDSHVQAAYASFLWETEEEADESAVPSYIGFHAPTSS